MILAALAGYSAVASYGTPFGRMGLDYWFDTPFGRGILAALAGYSAVASYGTSFGRVGLDWGFDTRCARMGLGFG